MIEVRCPLCGGLVEYGPWEDGARQAVCECGRTHWLMLDQGTLDLGIVRESVMNDRFDYKLWPDGSEEITHHE